VAGGGIGGLAAAIGLRRAGWAVTVLERAAEPGEVGAGWSFARNAVRAADALGVGDGLRAVSVPTEAGATLRTPDGRYLMRFRAGRDTPLLANHRADLHRVLLAELPAGIVRAGAEVTGVEPAGDRMVASYRTPDGPGRAEADLLVGADGIRSTVRRACWPGTPTPVFQRILLARSDGAGLGMAGSRLPDLSTWRALRRPPAHRGPGLLVPHHPPGPARDTVRRRPRRGTSAHWPLARADPGAAGRHPDGCRAVPRHLRSGAASILCGRPGRAAR
jgi:2-polyprenyl-6-methoxyphenol hydroxylase-like FAD-dependent oxidoreductase